MPGIPAEPRQRDVGDNRTNPESFTRKLAGQRVSHKTPPTIRSYEISDPHSTCARLFNEPCCHTGFILLKTL